ncbi:MAG: UDP-N-acetylglucosamine--N-acetylmuramyl-(pentapeptide) pyrophosphoryl-undecaprenol N-acetylglucosamine transferase [Treponema sp.]|nr:UDP-N-acetylglucosamine--N-acetylmuramyl-(pentapeptide) pyrophosphoryl-undecaprenol N-acetylglucosamine transferase [Treponema sp.]
MNKHEAVTIAFAGGGTGGHVYPGLAVADELRSLASQNGMSVRICWIGSSRGMDRTIVEKNVNARGEKSADIFYGIPAGKLRRYVSINNLLDIFKIIGGFFASLAILLKIKPALLFSKGGFVSVPPCMAARLLRIPVFTHECDFTPGLATKLNARSAERILLSYRESARYFKESIRAKTVVTGNPVRPAFYNASSERGRAFLGLAKNAKPVLLVLGGSSGARQINELVWENCAWLCERFIVVHQMGMKRAAVDALDTAASRVGASCSVAAQRTDTAGRAVESCADAASCAANATAALRAADSASDADAPTAAISSCDYKPYQFIYEQMSDVIAASDVVLSRAGANAIWECAVLKKPLVLIPLAGSGTRGDQEENAAFFEKNGAALVLGRGNADGDHMRAALEKLLQMSEREKMRENCARLVGSERPAKKIAELLFARLLLLLR